MALNSGGGGGGAGQIRAGAAFIELWTKNNLAAGLNSASKDLKAFGGKVTGLGRSFLGLGAVGGAALGGVFAASTKRAAAFDGLANKLGDTTENLSAFAYAAERTGIGLEGLLDNFENWPERLSQAAAGTGELAETFRALGIDAAKLKTLPLTEQILGLADAMQGVTNNTDRLALLGSLFSDKGQAFNQLFKMGSGGIRGLMAEAGGVGAVVGTEQARQAKEVERAWSKSWTSIKNAALSVGDALLPTAPALTKIGQEIVNAAAASRQWINENKEVVFGIGAAVAGVSALGLGMMALGPAIRGFGVAWSTLTGIVGASFSALAIAKTVLLTPLLALPAAVAAAGAAWVAFTTEGQSAARGWANSIAEAMGPTVENLRTSLSSAFDSLKDGDFAGAFRVGLDAVKVEWARFMLYLQETWASFNVNWERAIDATGIALVRLGRRLGIYSPQEAKDIEKQLLDMNAQAEKQLANPLAVKEARVELANAMDWQKWNLKELAAKRAGDGWFGGGALWGADTPMAGQIAAIAGASRGTFGGGASAGFFGGSGGVGEKLVAAANKGNEIAEKTLKAIGNLRMGDGGMMFVGGK